jgi:hypothetical protein
VLETKGFVLFWLCLAGDCALGAASTWSTRRTFLEATLEHERDEQVRYCEVCAECVDADAAVDGAIDNGARQRCTAQRLADYADCDSCYAQCQNIANMEENGYADAAKYVNTQTRPSTSTTRCLRQRQHGCGVLRQRHLRQLREADQGGAFTNKDCSVYDDSVVVDR